MEKYEKTIESYMADIKEEIPFVDLKPFSHNIISCNLRIIAEKFGKDKANEVIKQLKLTKLGWKTEK